MIAAFKEWAIVVDALARGEQIFILRKGGIHEGREGFRLEHDEFLFFPTLFHQQRNSVIDKAQNRYDEIAPSLPAENMLRLEWWASVVEHHRLSDFEAVKRLAGQHVWREEVLAERFEWGREQSIFAIAVRVHRLPMAIELPMLPEYGGCKSWIEVSHPVMPAGSTPVLDDAVFAERLNRFRRALGAFVS